MRNLIICLMLLCAASFAGIDVLVAHADPGSISGATANITDAEYDSVTFMDVSSASGSIPDVATLQNYDAVLTWANYTYADATTFGNNLADYVDAGGGVVICMFGLDSSWGMAGRLMTDAAYCPLVPGSCQYSSTDLGSFDTTHDIMSGVTAISGIYYWANCTLESGATWLADLVSGSTFAGINVDENVVGVNIYPGDYRYWTGDGWILLNNAIKYVGIEEGPAVVETSWGALKATF